MENNKPFLVALFLIVVFFLGISGYFMFQNYQLQNQVLQLAQTEQTTSTPTENQPTTIRNTQTPTTPQASPTTDPYANWKTYTNNDVGFQFSYPNNFQALDDQNNLYGWPNAVVLLYQGGQSYDIPVEVWDNQTEYQQNFQNNTFDYEVKQANGKYVTFSNMNDHENFEEIVNSFQEI